MSRVRARGVPELRESKMSELMQASRQWVSRPADERFTSLTDLHSHCVEQRSRSRGAVVSTRQLEARPDPNDETGGLMVYGPSGAGYAPSNWAFGQIATLAEAPAGYLRTLPAPIAADCVNYGLKFKRDVDDVGILIRKPNGHAGEIAAATGPRYGRIWNSEITAQLVRRFGNGVDDGDWRVPGEFGRAVTVTKDNTTLYASDRDLFVFLADERNRIDVPNRRNGASGSMARGFFVWNSEVGAQVFGFAQFLFDYVCCNRIVWGAQDYKELRIRHTVSAPDRFLEEIEPTLRRLSHDSAAPIVDTIEAVKEKRVDDLADFLKSRRFAANMAVKVNAAHEREEGRPIETAWDVVTGMTAYAKTISYQDERVALEREAGKILDLCAA
jgi:hypothetical protein